LENATFTDNQAKNGGAIYITKQSTIDIFQLFSLLENSKFSVLTNNTFERNIATNSGGALKLLYKDPKVHAENTFKDNSDPFGLSVSDNEPSHYRFSFYKMLSDKKIKTDEELYELMENSSLTVISFFCCFFIHQ